MRRWARSLVGGAYMLSLMACSDTGVAPSNVPPMAQGGPPPTEPPKVSVSGVIRESAPTSSVAVAGATVAVEDGIDRGKTTQSDADGQFQMSLTTGDATMSFVKEGYDRQTVTIARASADAPLTISLAPSQGIERSTFVGSLCTSSPPYLEGPNPQCWGNDFPYPTERRHELITHRRGSAVITVTYPHHMDYGYNHLDLDLSCNGERVVHKTFLNNGVPENAQFDFVEPYLYVGRPLNAVLDAACRWEVVLSEYTYDRKGGPSFTMYTVQIDHER